MSRFFRQHIGRAAVEAGVSVGRIVRIPHPAEQPVTLKDDPTPRVGICNPIDPIPGVINVGVESRVVFKEVAVTSTADEVVIPGTEKGVGFFCSRRPELLCTACGLFFPNDLSGHRFKHHFLSFLILDVV